MPLSLDSFGTRNNFIFCSLYISKFLNPSSSNGLKLNEIMKVFSELEIDMKFCCVFCN